MEPERRTTPALAPPADAPEGFRDAFEEAGIGMALLGLDGRFMRVNRELCRILGRSERELLDGTSIVEITHPDDRRPHTGDLGALIAGDVRRYRRDRRYLHADGSLVWGATTVTIVRDGAGRPRYAIGQLEDITPRKLADQRAERAQRQQAAVLRLSQLALGEQDLGTLAAAAVATLAEVRDDAEAGLARVPSGGDRRLETLAGTVDAAHAALALDGGQPVVVRDAGTETRFDVRALVSRGVTSAVAVPVAGQGDEDFGVLALHAPEPEAFDADDLAFLQAVGNVLTGAVRRLAVEADLRHQALHDPLTELPNRALLLDRLRHAVARCRRDGTFVALLYLDLDDFKEVNESLGHEAGDDLLRALSARLGEALRPSDTLARVGGDEFAVVCDGLAGPAEGVAIAGRVLSAVARPLGLDDAEVKPSTSIGIAVADPAGRATAEDLVRDAAVASYRAKSAGRGAYEIFDDRMRAEAIDRVELTNDLRAAIESGALHLAFQPIVGFGQHRVVGLEALARWTHPTRGEIPPGRFIPLAEQHGLIGALGSWVLRATLDQLGRWRDAGEPVGELSVSVNVSRVQLGQPRLADEVMSALNRCELAPRQLVVEVTESAVMDDPEAAHATLAALHARGVKLALDDFGVGQSSLACLRDLPLDMVKLDRGFVTSIATSRESGAIVRAVTDMARALRFPVIAEGIETPAQATVIEALGCDMGQGFLYARPVTADALPATVAELDATLADRELTA